MKLNHANLGFKGIEGQQNLFLDNARDTIESIYEYLNRNLEKLFFDISIFSNPVDIKARLQGTAAEKSYTTPTSQKAVEDSITVNTLHVKPNVYVRILKYCEQKSKELFWLSLYTLVLWAIFAERAYCM